LNHDLLPCPQTRLLAARRAIHPHEPLAQELVQKTGGRFGTVAGNEVLQRAPFVLSKRRGVRSSAISRRLLIERPRDIRHTRDAALEKNLK
jgi:hypothetical protein